VIWPDAQVSRFPLESQTVPVPWARAAQTGALQNAAPPSAAWQDSPVGQGVVELTVPDAH
jgi:hypothetical protein